MSTKTERAMLVDCTECGAVAGSPCVFIPLKTLPYEALSPARRARIDATGTPTKRSHNARFNAAPREKRAIRHDYTMHSVDLTECKCYELRGMVWRMYIEDAIRRFSPKACRDCVPDPDGIAHDVLVVRSTR